MQALDKDFLKALEKIQYGKNYTVEDAALVLEAEREVSAALFEAADRVREQVFGKGVYLRGIIEFSNHCQKNCHYCGIRAANKINRYRMPQEEIIEAARHIKNAGIGTVVLQSGEDPWWNPERMVQLIKNLKDMAGITITLSIGERDFQEYALFKKAGADRFLLKIETTSEKIFSAVHPDDQLSQRMKCSKWLGEIGYMNGSGCIIGLPGQTATDIASDILWFKDMKMDMIGIGPFIPAQNTPLANLAPGSTFMTLKAVALTRLICQKAFLPATTALETLEDEGQLKALKAGANVIMLNFTPPQYKKDYNIYNNKKAIGLENALKTIERAGRFLQMEVQNK
ncbi:MAG: [FeFe] hydrogenase H-cluster radical SAM maturase HydE [Bacillota bacterium]